MKSYGCFIRSVALALMCAGALLTSCSEKSLGAYDESELDFYAAPPSGYNNLSALSTANCYILNQSGAYCIAAVKGNDSDGWLTTAKYAEVLWESFGTSTAPEVGDLIKSVSYKDGYIAFQTADTFKEGNAVIAAKDESDDILWSWHIWMTDQPQEHVYKNNAGTMMDRNLGATSETPGDVGALGLLYQWGRKDPFLNSTSIELRDREAAASTITWPSVVPAYPWNGTIEYATANPTTLICVSYVEANYDWYYASSSTLTDNTRWTDSNSAKSIYDPCPAGWRVPDGGPDGIWTCAGFNDVTFDDNCKGMSFNISSPSVTWYPASGERKFHDCSLDSVGWEGCYWSASTTGIYAYTLYFNSLHLVPDNYSHRAEALAVRCAKE